MLQPKFSWQDIDLTADCLNAKQSQAFGRRVCTFHAPVLNREVQIQAQRIAQNTDLQHASPQQAHLQKMVLKYQVIGVQSAVEQGFRHELDFYRAQSAEAPVLPWQIVSLPQVPDFQNTTGEGLVLPWQPLCFQKSCADLSLPEIYALLESACDALLQLHQCGWIHGDIKTQHFVQYAGQAKLIDLEQAHPIANRRLPELNATPRYMAPELFQGQGKSVQSDIYAFGIVLLEWLGQQRLQAHSYQDWAVLHCQQLQFELPSRIKSLQPLLECLLARRIERRLDNLQVLKFQLNKLKNKEK